MYWVVSYSVVSETREKLKLNFFSEDRHGASIWNTLPVSKLIYFNFSNELISLWLFKKTVERSSGNQRGNYSEFRVPNQSSVFNITIRRNIFIAKM